MNIRAWKRRLLEWQDRGAIASDLTPYRVALARIDRAGREMAGASDRRLIELAHATRTRAAAGSAAEALLPTVFALAREASGRVLGLRPFDEQVMASVALHHGKLVEMQTGEGKTLAAVMPAALEALYGRGVHVLTFNDYLARRDAAWMGPVYTFLGLTVGTIQEGMTAPGRRLAYEADVTYATAREAGFDFLRMHLCRAPEDVAHRRFNFAIVDEADSILIDEARVPLVVAGDRPSSDTSLYRIAKVVALLEQGLDWESDENRRNVALTERGIDLIEAGMGCGGLHAPENYRLLTEVNLALHARALLKRNVDYIVRDGRIELVDEFTGRIVQDRRWPDGLQAALEAKERIRIQPGGRILGSITLHHYVRRYPRLCGMTATARPAAREFKDFYGLEVVPIPTHHPCIRCDRPALIFTHRRAKYDALVAEIGTAHNSGRPVLVGTRSVAESERLARRLVARRIPCRVLNAKNDEDEAEIIAKAGAVGAVTISTNMAGRGTDIKLGGIDGTSSGAVARLDGLYVIATNLQESKRMDDQLRGRAGRQGDPGESSFFTSLEDDLLVRFGIDVLIPKRLRPPLRNDPVDHPAIRNEVERAQRIVEGQNFEIRRTLFRYSSVVEEQRVQLQGWRTDVLLGQAEMDICSRRAPVRHRTLQERFGTEAVHRVEQAITLHHIDRAWEEHLAFVAEVREGIHLVGLAGLDPLHEFQKEVSAAFIALQDTIEERIEHTFAGLVVTDAGIDLEATGIGTPASTWTYLVDDSVQSDLQQMLFGRSGYGYAAGALMTWPLLAVWGIWERWKRRDQ